MKNYFNARNIAFLAVLLALDIALQAFGGSLTIGLVTLNFSLIPIVLGALLLGPVAGGILGFANGVVVLIQVVMAPSGFYYIIWTYSPLVTTLICLVKTTAAGIAAGFCYRLIAKKNRYAAVFVSSAVVPIVNTALFVLGCLCMPQTIAAFQAEVNNAGMNIFVFICVVLVTFNFFIELAINLVLSPALHTVCRAAEKLFAAKRKKGRAETQGE